MLTLQTANIFLLWVSAECFSSIAWLPPPCWFRFRMVQLFFEIIFGRWNFKPWRLAYVLNWRSSQNKQFQNGNFGKKTISIQALLLSVHQFGHGLSAKVSRFGWNIPFISSCIWLKKQVKHGGNGVKKFAISCFLSNCFSPFETLNTGMY